MKTLKFNHNGKNYVLALMVKSLDIALDEWEESKHPRADNGQFGCGNGKKKENKKMRYVVDDVFGRSYSEYSGKPEQAIEKLMKEKEGFVPSAIYRKEIGDIDFVYGDPDPDSGYGLAHIAYKHGEDVVKLVPEIIRTGSIDDKHRKFGRLYVVSGQYKSIIRLDWNSEERNWLASAFLEEKQNP